MDPFVFLSFLVAQMVKKLSAMRRTRFNPWIKRFPVKYPLEYPLQYSLLENSMGREAWWATAHGVKKVGHNWVTKTHTRRKCVSVLFSRIFENILWSGVPQLVFSYANAGRFDMTCQNVSVTPYQLHPGASALILSFCPLHLPCNNLLCQWGNAMAQKLYNN